ncbi:hypothetical protein SY94_0888 [Agrobacterium tumefaciens]|nr:hypothetical protein SY94_0888 [Agrobacterium tumefaciens]
MKKIKYNFSNRSTFAAMVLMSGGGRIVCGAGKAFHGGTERPPMRT